MLVVRGHAASYAKFFILSGSALNAMKGDALNVAQQRAISISVAMLGIVIFGTWRRQHLAR
jgi:hypothetical protein